MSDPSGRPPKAPRRSRLFQSRPDVLLVDEWVPNITLPAPPDAPLEVDAHETLLDEHGLPTLEAEPEEEVRAGPARLFVGVGQRGASLASSESEEEAAEGIVVNEPEDFFVAELRLPRPEDGLPFGLASQPEPEHEDLLLADEASDPALAMDELALPFSVSVEAPDPMHLGAFGDEDDDDEEFSSDLDTPLAAPPAISLEPSLAREPLAGAVRSRSGGRSKAGPPAAPAAEQGEDDSRPGGLPPDHPIMTPSRRRVHGGGSPPPLPPIVVRPVRGLGPDQRSSGVAHSRPFWTRKRRLPEPPPAQAPRFEPREASSSEPIKARLFRPSALLVLLAVLALVVALELLGIFDLGG